MSLQLIWPQCTDEIHDQVKISSIMDVIISQVSLTGSKFKWVHIEDIWVHTIKFWSMLKYKQISPSSKPNASYLRFTHIYLQENKKKPNS